MTQRNQVNPAREFAMPEERTTQRKHTPGPWNWHGPYMDGGYKVSAMNEQDHVTLRIYVKAEDEEKDRTEANARLIASAPDLLAERDRLLALNKGLVAALCAIDKRVDELETDDHAPVAFEELRGIQETACAALAKAKGAA